MAQNTIKLTSTRKEFAVTDESGYKFIVVLTLDDEWGWAAEVSFATHGFKSEQSALNRLAVSVERFLEMLKNGVEI